MRHGSIGVLEGTVQTLGHANVFNPKMSESKFQVQSSALQNRIKTFKVATYALGLDPISDCPECFPTKTPLLQRWILSLDHVGNLEALAKVTNFLGNTT